MLGIVLYLLSTPAHAACAQVGSTGVWRCPDTGNVYTNGSSLRDFLIAGGLGAPAWACGDTIVLDAGVEYRSPDVSADDPYFYLPHQTGCNGKKTQIISSAIHEIPLGAATQPITAAIRGKMASLTVCCNSVFRAAGDGLPAGGSNNYAIRGIRMASSAHTETIRGKISNLAFNTAGTVWDSASRIETYALRDIEIDRCLMEDYQESAYGAANIDNTDGRAFVRYVTNGVYAPMWNFYWHDSWVNLTGYTNTPGESGVTDWISISGGTAASPAKLTGTTLTTQFGITYNASCSDACKADACWNTPACKRVAIKGATGSWATLNGIKWIRARADGDVDVITPGVDWGGVDSTYFDSSALGSFTGTVSASGVAIATQYAYLGVWDQGVRIIDNFLETTSMPVFLGGTDGPRIDMATIQAGSTITSLILDHTRGLRVGDLVSLRTDGTTYSAYCQNPAGACWSGPYWIRTGRVTAISGTTVTLEPWGPEGIDSVNPVVGGEAWWKNIKIHDIEVRGNALSRGYRHANSDAGKGAIEMKHCENCLIDGNVMGGYLDSADVPKMNMGSSTYFVETKNQGGTDANSNVTMTRFSNNYSGGEQPSGQIQCLWDTWIQNSDQERSVQIGRNVFYEHNLHVGCQPHPAVLPVRQHFPMIAAVDSGFLHNTYVDTISPSITGRTRFAYNLDCNYKTGPHWPEYVQLRNAPIKDNISGYGFGSYVGAPDAATCWPTRAADIAGNLIVDTEAVGSVAILADAGAGNRVINSYTGVWAGSCAWNTWWNCGVSNASSHAGTATDGGNPGADVEQVRDRLKRWSERAGLLKADTTSARMVINPGAWQLGSTKAAVTFRLYSSTPASGCTVQVFTNRNRATAHSDTPSAAACNRSGSFASGNTVTFLIGSTAGLTASTTYFYRITDGPRVMVGEFTTRAAGSGTTNGYLTSAATTLTYSLNADLSGGTTLAAAASQTVPVAAGTVVYWQQGTGLRGVFVAP